MGRSRDADGPGQEADDFLGRDITGHTILFKSSEFSLADAANLVFYAGFAAFVALFGTPAVTEVLEAFDRSFVFIVACAAASGLMRFVLAMLMRGRRPPTPNAVPAPGVRAA